MLDVATAAGSVLAAFGLSGAAGLNAWIPLLAAGLLGPRRPAPARRAYDVLATTPGLIVLGVLFALDFVGDKVPAHRLAAARGRLDRAPGGGRDRVRGADRDADRRPLDRAVRARRVGGRLAARDARDDPPGVDDADRRRGQPGALVRGGRGVRRAQRDRRARAAHRACCCCSWSWSSRCCGGAELARAAADGADYADPLPAPAALLLSRARARRPAQAAPSAPTSSC